MPGGRRERPFGKGKKKLIKGEYNQMEKKRGTRVGKKKNLYLFRER